MHSASVLDRVRIYDPPPSHFDPHEASARSLRQYGLPERPDPDLQPELARLWRRAFARPITFIKPELRLGPAFMRRRAPDGKAEFSGTGWSGAVVNNSNLTHPGESIEWAFGQFVVPQVSPLDPIGEDLTIGFWVGIDGDGDQQVLQAGVRADVSGGFFGGNVSYSAWTEWLDAAHMDEPQDAAITIENFPVRPGDWISVLVCAPEPDQGHIVLGNSSQGQMAVINLTADPGISVHGSSAEWIVEGISDALPYFHEFVFMDCIGGTQAHVFDLSSGHPRDARAIPPPSQEFGELITSSAIITPNIATVLWKHFD
jgi:Peptidase A4 family